MIDLRKNTTKVTALDKYKIEYGIAHSPRRDCVIQLNMNAICSIKFFNWNRSYIGTSEDPYIVAIWRIKELKQPA